MGPWCPVVSVGSRARRVSPQTFIFKTDSVRLQVSSLEAPRRGGARLELERRSLDLERELRPERDSDVSLDDTDHLV